ncbi:L-aspartate oxidase [Candidatus Mycalebacterium sp.]
MSKQVLETDVLVIGGGLAGLYAAFCAASYGSKVALVTRTTLKESNSYWAQGGIAAAVDVGDSTILHADDTLKAGCGLCFPEAVEVLVREGRERVIEMAEFGMEFDSDRHGFDLGLEGGHSKRRVLHAGGAATGRKMVEFLISSVEKEKGVALFERTEVEGLISSGDRCFGAWTVGPDREPGEVRTRSTILATGGAAALFGRTTNPQAAKGEVIRMAYEAGAEIMDMEFVQFHPTAFYSKSGKCFLISEALRGEGARLVDENGEGFMAGRHPFGDLAPRDAVSKAIHSRMSESGRNFVCLDLTDVSPEVIKNRFGDIYRRCLENGVDCLSEPIPVAPAAHYTIGGVKSGLGGETSLKGLYCCGETACAGVHGANRLASNSLLECLVFSKRAAHSAAENTAPFPRDLPARPVLRSGGGSAERYSELIRTIVSKADSLLGIVREAGEMKSFIAYLENTLGEAEDIAGWRGDRLAAMATACLMMARAALMREETRGVHIRRDFPETDPKFCKHSVFGKNSGGLNPRLEEL